MKSCIVTPLPMKTALGYNKAFRATRSWPSSKYNPCCCSAQLFSFSSSHIARCQARHSFPPSSVPAMPRWQQLPRNREARRKGPVAATRAAVVRQKLTYRFVGQGNCLKLPFPLSCSDWHKRSLTALSHRLLDHKVNKTEGYAVIPEYFLLFCRWQAGWGASFPPLLILLLPLFWSFFYVCFSSRPAHMFRVRAKKQVNK